LAEELGLRYLETSAKTNINVEEAFFALARLVPASPLFLPSFFLLGAEGKMERTADTLPLATLGICTGTSKLV